MFDFHGERLALAIVASDIGGKKKLGLRGIKVSFVSCVPVALWWRGEELEVGR